jgi:hypothetical protein
LPQGGELFDLARHCKTCWLYHHDDDYHQLWGGEGKAAKAPLVTRQRSLPCLYLGEVVDRLGCPCPGRWLRRCGLHGTTTIEQCKTCSDYQEDEGFAPGT